MLPCAQSSPSLFSFIVSSCLLVQASLASAQPAPDQQKLIAKGEYIAKTAGCHDCHTPTYMESAGVGIPKEQWLTGTHVGFKGPWGTTYPVNLRLYVQTKTEQEWLARVRQPMRPPMPWFALRDMNDEDLVALYQFFRSLGPEGVPAPAAVAPGEQVTTPYIDFEPKNLPSQAAATH